MSNPYLSIIATTRNDNHGGDLLKRTTAFIEGVYYQAKHLPFSIELIIVEWNPPKDKKSLKEILPKPPENSVVVLRIIQVPSNIHQQYSLHKKLSLFQMTAKNIGIRRAKASFILCTNIDLLFSNDLFKFFASKPFKKNVFYRANRVDVEKKVLAYNDIENMIKKAPKHTLFVLGKKKGSEYLKTYPKWVYYSSKLSGFLNKITYWKYIHTKKTPQMKVAELDTMACGDFTLMHKSDWEKIQGYPELDLYSIHIDSMALIAARALNIKQEILPQNMCSYHIYHKEGWESYKENPVDLIKFIEKRPGLDWHAITEAAHWLIENNEKWNLNSKNWGFNDVEFEEEIFKSSAIKEQLSQ